MSPRGLLLAAGLLLLLLLALCHSSRGEVGLLRAQWDGQSGLQRCVLYNPAWQQLPLSLSRAPLQRAVMAQPPTGCSHGAANITNAAQLKAAAALFQRGCNFSTTVLAAAADGATAVVILNSGDQDMVAPAAMNRSDYATAKIPVVMVDYETGLQLHEAATAANASLALQLFQIKIHAFDPNSVVFFAMAWFALVCGSLLQTAATRHKIRRALVSQEGEMLLPEEAEEEGSAEQADISLKFIGIFLFAACSVLVLLYFFYKYLVYVVIALFVFASGAALLRMVEIAASHCSSSLLSPERLTWQLPCGLRTNFAHLSFALCCYALAVTWAVLRHYPYAFVLQDVLGLAIIITALEAIRLPCFKVGTVLLAVFFFYDIFFVFITPYLTPNHDSVMVTAATGGGGGDGDDGGSVVETIPLVLRLPRFMPVPCYTSESLLGFGDVVIPGIAVAHAMAFDVHLMYYALLLRLRLPAGMLLRYGYFLTALIAYTLGLALTYVGMTLMDAPQPALMYLAPSLLLGLWGRAWWCGQAALFWHGWRVEPPEAGKKRDVEEGLLQQQEGGAGAEAAEDAAAAAAGSVNGGDSRTRRRLSVESD